MGEAGLEDENGTDEEEELVEKEKGVPPLHPRSGEGQGDGEGRPRALLGVPFRPDEVMVVNKGGCVEEEEVEIRLCCVWGRSTEGRVGI